MLVLTRQVGESILIDGGLCVTVMAVQRGRVRLGVTAPKAVSVFREELQTRPSASPCQDLTSSPTCPGV